MIFRVSIRRTQSDPPPPGTHQRVYLHIPSLSLPSFGLPPAQPMGPTTTPPCAWGQRKHMFLDFARIWGIFWKFQKHAGWPLTGRR